MGGDGVEEGRRWWNREARKVGGNGKEENRSMETTEVRWCGGLLVQGTGVREGEKRQSKNRKGNI